MFRDAVPVSPSLTPCVLSPSTLRAYLYPSRRWRVSVRLDLSVSWLEGTLSPLVCHQQPQQPRDKAGNADSAHYQFLEQQLEENRTVQTHQQVIYHIHHRHTHTPQRHTYPTHTYSTHTYGYHTYCKQTYNAHTYPLQTHTALTLQILPTSLS